jgi:hypothetical protein
MTAEQARPDANPWRSKTAAIFRVRKAGGGLQKLLTLGGGAGSWIVADSGGHTLAIAEVRFGRLGTFTIDAGGRRLTFQMPGMYGFSHPTEFEIVDDSDQRVLSGKITYGGRDNRNLIDEVWTVTLASGDTLSWIHRRREAMLGFYDLAGAPVLLLGHDASFDTSAGGSTFRILLRLWAGVAASKDRYVALHELTGTGKTLPAEAVPALVLLAVWLERTADGRYPTPADQPT